MDKYPRFTFRLTPTVVQELRYLRVVRSRSTGQIVREAIGFYYRAKFVWSSATVEVEPKIE